MPRRERHPAHRGPAGRFAAGGRSGDLAWVGVARFALPAFPPGRRPYAIVPAAAGGTTAAAGRGRYRADRLGGGGGGAEGSVAGRVLPPGHRRSTYASPPRRRDGPAFRGDAGHRGGLPRPCLGFGGRAGVDRRRIRR